MAENSNTASAEKQVWSRFEEEDIQFYILEDKPYGKTTFLLQNGGPIFVEVMARLYLFATILAWMMRDASDNCMKYYFRFLLLTIPFYPLAYALTALFYFRFSHASPPLLVLIFLLKEVEEQGSHNAEIDWRLIASYSNQLAREKRVAPVFYSSDHCMKYFRDLIVPEVEKETYSIMPCDEYDDYLLDDDWIFRSRPYDTLFRDEQAYKDLARNAVLMFKSVTDDQFQV